MINLGNYGDIPALKSFLEKRKAEQVYKLPEQKFYDLCEDYDYFECLSDKNLDELEKIIKKRKEGREKENGI